MMENEVKREIKKVQIYSIKENKGKDIKSDKQVSNDFKKIEKLFKYRKGSKEGMIKINNQKIKNLLEKLGICNVGLGNVLRIEK